jgi:Bacterial RNA polymerase, alpha chain C terminal domain
MSEQQEVVAVPPIVIVMAPAKNLDEMKKLVDELVNAKFTDVVFGQRVSVLGLASEAAWWHEPIKNDASRHCLMDLLPDMSRNQLEQWVACLEPDEFAQFARQHALDLFRQDGWTASWSSMVKMVVTYGNIGDPTEATKRALDGAFPNAEWWKFVSKYDHSIAEYKPTSELSRMLYPYPGSPGEASARTNITIQELDICAKAYNCLRRAGIWDVSELINRTRSQLDVIPGVGEKTLKDIEEGLAKRGLSLREG